MSKRQKEDTLLADRLQASFQANRRVYGSPRLHAEMHAQGVRCSRKWVARLMRELYAHRARHRTVTTKNELGARITLNVLQQDFTAGCLNQKWAGDITAIWTYEGWLYLAVVLDLFSRRVIGWAMAARQDETLVTKALHMALLGRHSADTLLCAFGSRISVYQ